MVGKNKHKSMLICLLVAGSFCGWNISAGQVPTDPSIQKRPSPLPTVTPIPEKSDEPIKIETELVSILFTAQDKDRRLLTDLKKDDIRILEDGKLQEVFAYTRQTDLPLSLAILIDTSTSQERTLPDEKMAANFFIENIVRTDKDEAAVISFTGEATLEQGMTNSITRLKHAIDGTKVVHPFGYIGGGVILGTPPVKDNPAVGSTAIWDAIWVTGEEILGPAPERTRRAIILLTDGVNTYGRKKLDDAVTAALRAEAVIYAIGIGDTIYDGVDKRVLKTITENTGGRAFFPKDEIELRQAFEQIQKEMRSQYLIAYEPTNPRRDGAFRKIEIQIASPILKKQKIQLTYRQGYFAKSESKQKE